MTSSPFSRFLLLGLPVLLLAGCAQSSGNNDVRGTTIRVANDLNVYDTGTMDAERFARQTYPVWNRTGPYRERDLFREERYTYDRKPIVRPEPPDLPVHTSDQGNVQGLELDDGVSASDTSLDDDMTTQSISEAMQPMPLTTNSIPAGRLAHYGKLDDAGHWLPAIPVGDVPTRFLRREVAYASSQRPGTIIVDTASRHLYLILGNGKAMRYGVGIGRQGYAWKGEGRIQYKRTWPHWTPSDEYVSKKPEMKMFSASYGGLVGGIKNPLGARALYIFANGKDTLFRVHGTPDWKSIGKNVSSGCIRMFNQDVIDLYSRVPNGATIIVQ